MPVIPAGPAFLRAEPPAVGRIIGQPVVTVIAFRVHDGAEGAGFLELRQHPHQPKMMANRDNDAGAPAGLERRLRVSFA
jgi:hypothetical protein